MHSVFLASLSFAKVDCLEWILSHGGSVTDKDDLGGTALHDAAEQGQVSQHSLVYQNASVTLIINSHSPLNLDQVGSISVLLRHGVDAHCEDYDGLKPIDLAKGNKHEECVEILFKALTPTILVNQYHHW